MPKATIGRKHKPVGPYAGKGAHEKVKSVCKAKQQEKVGRKPKKPNAAAMKTKDEAARNQIDEDVRLLYASLQVRFPLS